MILVNGSPAASLPADDRGLAYGDGVFRTMRVVDGLPLHWALHYQKLAADCLRLNIACPAEVLLLEDVRQVAAGHAAAAAKIIVTRGSGQRGYAPPLEQQPLRVVSASPVPMGYASKSVEQGIQVRLCNLRLSHQPALAGAKHLNRLENVLARAEWQEASVGEGLLLDQSGHAIGGTMSNLFIVRNGSLYTPDLSRCGVAGVTRDRVKCIAGQISIDCHETEISLQSILAADELFLVNSLIGLWPVVRLDMHHWPVGPLSKQLHAALQAEDAALEAIAPAPAN